jgi:tetratricopeptide (TPR) repeat protein
MAENTNETRIGEGWGLHRAGQNDEAIRVFDEVLRTDRNNIDAHYGLGLAQRARHMNAQALESFKTALELSERRLEEIRGASQENDLSTTGDDRYMMLIRMIKQRIEELEKYY